jgi:mono/diheme cytochrome c family protein
MENLMKEKGILWPKFQGNEMLDLLYYIRSASHEPSRTVGLLPANPDAGGRLFSTKGCIHCHAIRGKGGQPGHDLGGREVFPRTPTQIAGLMWNHSPEMWEAMKEAGVERPFFSEREMADLVAYLYAIRYFDEPGNRVEGEKIFSDKGCYHCHIAGGEGPNLRKWKGYVSPITMACVMWNHGLTILRKIEKKGMQWPLFEGTEFVDLMEYLNTDGGEK